MDRETRNKILTVLGVLVMVGGMFWGIQFVQKGSQGSGGQSVSGTTVFNGTIRTYEPFLVITGQMPDALLAQLRGDDRVKAVISEQQGYLINISTRDDVFSVAQMLRQNGILPNAVANIVLPASIEVHLANGSVQSVSSPGTVSVWTEPLVDIDNDVTVRMIATLQGGQLVSYSSAVVLAGSAALPTNATITSLDGVQYVFIVPWADRSSIDENSLSEAYGNGSVLYERNDVISFPQGLDIAQMTEKKALPYITYISDTSASVDANFSDMNRTLSDFSGINVTFPDSMLAITTNETVSLPYNGTTRFSYTASLPAQVGDYTLDTQVVRLELAESYAINDSIAVIINGTTIGNRIVDITSVEQG